MTNTIKILLSAENLQDFSTLECIRKSFSQTFSLNVKNMIYVDPHFKIITILMSTNLGNKELYIPQGFKMEGFELEKNEDKFNVKIRGSYSVSTEIFNFILTYSNVSLANIITVPK